VLIDGGPQRHAEGTYYIEWYEDGQRRQSVKESGEVLEQARRKAVALDAGKTGFEIADEDDQPERVRLADAVASYLKESNRHSANLRPIRHTSTALELFRTNCTRTYIQNVTRDDVLAFIRKLYDMAAEHGRHTIGRRSLRSCSKRTGSSDCCTVATGRNTSISFPTTYKRHICICGREAATESRKRTNI